MEERTIWGTEIMWNRDPICARTHRHTLKERARAAVRTHFHKGSIFQMGSLFQAGERMHAEGLVGHLF